MRNFVRYRSIARDRPVGRKLNPAPLPGPCLDQGHGQFVSIRYQNMKIGSRLIRPHSWTRRERSVKPMIVTQPFQDTEELFHKKRLKSRLLDGREGGIAISFKGAIE